jgi:hypothetical protein
MCGKPVLVHALGVLRVPRGLSRAMLRVLGAQELERLANDPAAYEAKLAWKRRALEEQAPAFLKMMEKSHVRQPHTRCQLCRIALRNRYRPQNYTTCLFNKEYMADYRNR